LKLETNFGICLHIEGRSDMAWDKLEIQQSIKEQTLEASAMQDVPLLQLAEEQEPDVEVGVEADADEDVDGVADTETVGVGEAPKKKSRRRPRHRKRKSPETSAENASPDNPVLETSSIDEAPPMAVPPPRVQSPKFPAKPLKIVSALPDEFFPVDLSGDIFAPEPAPDEPTENN
jgi:hypothetical protein